MPGLRTPWRPGSARGEDNRALIARAELRQDRVAFAFGVALDALVGRAAVRVHRHQQRAEAPDAEAPDAFRVEVVHVDLLDRFDPGGLQRSRAADHREIGAADVAEGVERALPHSALADDDADALTLHQRAGEALHALRCGGADAHRFVAGRTFVGDRH